MLPLAIPLAFLSTALNYAAQKINLLRIAKQPDMLGVQFVEVFIGLMPYAVLGMTFSSVIVFDFFAYGNITF